MSEPKVLIHPGIEIKRSVIPSSLSVTKAAERLGVGRPALSNLLNGKASLSLEMAMRLEQTFGASGKDLLAMQARYNEHKGHEERKNRIIVRPYAPTCHQITADQIAAWSDASPAWNQLAALLRVLVHSTGVDLEKVDFPAFGNAQRKGWDGQVNSGSATSWIPHGMSRWEFSCEKDVLRKANSDYKKRTEEVLVTERKATTFVFVTPRNWKKKEQWAKSKSGESQWRDVRAFDASDLEQWLEQSIPAQARFREFQGSTTDEQVASLDQIWDEWAVVPELKLSHRLFASAVQKHQDTLKEWFSNAPTDPLIVACDSSIEASVYLVFAIDQLRQIDPRIYDRTIVIRSRDAFKKISNSFLNFVVIVISSSGVEQDLAGLHKKTHTIIVRQRGGPFTDSHITLDPFVSHQDFRNALEDMEFDDNRIDQLIKESPPSPTILRRHISRSSVLLPSPWMNDQNAVRALIPFMFVGAWDFSVAKDAEILCRLAGKESGGIKQAIAELQHACEPPVWSIGDCGGIVCKIDALHAIHHLIIDDDLKNFLSIAKETLLEFDSASELPDNTQQATKHYEQANQPSSMLRQGICDTLVLMAVHGNSLLGKRLGMDIELETNSIVGHLLAPSSRSTWISQRAYLTQYAEAAPDTFLQIVEDDLRNSTPIIGELFAAGVGNLFSLGDCPRAELLWALELLAWKSKRLTKVALILAQLCQFKIDDNWTNTPLSSLASIFCARMPQTTAALVDCNKALAQIAKKFPKTAWKICMDQIFPQLANGWRNYRPHWRAEAREADQSVSVRAERIKKAKDHAIQLVLNWPYCPYDADMLGDLVEFADALPEERRHLVWDRIAAWSKTEPSDTQRVMLCERIRVCTLIRHRQLDGPAGALRDQAHDVYSLLKPVNSVARNSWLFFRHWVEPSADQIHDNEIDYGEREKQIEQQRNEALKEIWQEAGMQGVIDLCRSSEESGSIGFHLAEIHSGIKPAATLVQELLTNNSTDLRSKLDQCISGFLSKLDPQQRSKTLSQLLLRLTGQNELCIRLLLCAPFDNHTWFHVDGLSEDLTRRYWDEVNPPGWGYQSDLHVTKFVDELLKASRPRAAFFAAQRKWEFLDSKRLASLLRESAISDSEPVAHYRLDSYYVSEALDMLEERGDTSLDKLAELEFVLIQLLSRTRHKIHNLEAQLAKTPMLFIQMIMLAYRCNDNGKGHVEWRLSNSNCYDLAQSNANALLRRASRVPGTQVDDSINPKELKEWIEQARYLARQYNLADITDERIGWLLSRCLTGEDGGWPCEPVRDAIEEIKSPGIASGMVMGIRNFDTMTFRGRNGDRECQLSAKYRHESNKISAEYPYTSALLEQIACTYDSDMRWWNDRHDIHKNLRN